MEGKVDGKRGCVRRRKSLLDNNVECGELYQVHRERERESYGQI